MSTDSMTLMRETLSTAPMAPSYVVVYIASAIHSGSTLLDLLMGSHPQAVSVGEIVNIGAFANLTRVKSDETPDGNQCTCGAPTIWECSFWPRVNEVMEQSSGLTLRNVNVASQDDGEFLRHNQTLFNAIAKISGATCIVDSSKSFERLRRLMDSGIAPVVPVHLIRDPRAQYYSLRRRRWHGIVDSARRYNRHYLETRRALKGIPHVRVRYESLVASPEACLAEICKQAKLSFAKEQLIWTDRVHHNIGGNRMRLKGTSDIRPDNEWKQKLSWSRKLALSLLTLPTRCF